MPQDAMNHVFDRKPRDKPERPPKSGGQVRVTVLLEPQDLDRADALFAAKGFRTRHQMLQWLILYGLKYLENGRISPRTQTSTVVEVGKP